MDFLLCLGVYLQLTPINYAKNVFLALGCTCAQCPLATPMASQQFERLEARRQNKERTAAKYRPSDYLGRPKSTQSVCGISPMYRKDCCGKDLQNKWVFILEWISEWVTDQWQGSGTHSWSWCACSTACVLLGRVRDHTDARYLHCMCESCTEL